MEGAPDINTVLTNSLSNGKYTAPWLPAFGEGPRGPRRTAARTCDARADCPPDATLRNAAEQQLTQAAETNFVRSPVQNKTLYASTGCVC